MSDIDLQIALMESGRMNLMHLPAGAISWLWDRPTKQIDAAESLAVAANAHGNPVVDASLLKADQNVLLIKCEGGESFRIYPDGGFSHNDTPMDIGGCSSVLQGMGQSECEMDDNGHQMDVSADMPMDMPMGMTMDMPMGMPMAEGFDRDDSGLRVADEAGEDNWYRRHEDMAKQMYDAGETSKDVYARADNQEKHGQSVASDYTRMLASIIGVWEREWEKANPIGAVGLGTDHDPWDDDERVDGRFTSEKYGENLGDGGERDPDRAAERFRDGGDVGLGSDNDPWGDNDDEDYDDDGYGESIGDDLHLDAEAPESGVASPVGMTNLAGEPTMDEGDGFTGGVDDYSSDEDVQFDDVTYNRMRGAGISASPDQTPRERQYRIKSWLVAKLSEPTERSALWLYRHALYRMKTAYNNASSLDDTNTKIEELVDIAIERMRWENSHSKDATPPKRWRPDWTMVRAKDDVDEGDGAGGGFSMGSGSGAPYVGDISMDADPEMENLMRSRELGEASIHMFRNESDEELNALAKALGIID